MGFTVAAITYLLAGGIAASPVEIEKRNDSCGLWDVVHAGNYTLNANLWGASAGNSGSWQCIGLDWVNGNSIGWHTEWDWQGGPNSVKSYTNVAINMDPKQIWAINSIPTSWDWVYSGSAITADVSYDMFTSSSASGKAEFEIMIWLGALGGAGPISSTGSPVDTPTLAGTTWNLYKGPNGSTTVYSFVAESQQDSFSGDIIDFLYYLEWMQRFNANQYLLSIQAGTEPFEGTNAFLTTSSFSIELQ